MWNRGHQWAENLSLRTFSLRFITDVSTSFVSGVHLITLSTWRTLLVSLAYLDLSFSLLRGRGLGTRSLSIDTIVSMVWDRYACWKFQYPLPPVSQSSCAKPSPCRVICLQPECSPHDKAPPSDSIRLQPFLHKFQQTLLHLEGYGHQALVNRGVRNRANLWKQNMSPTALKVAVLNNFPWCNDIGLV